MRSPWSVLMALIFILLFFVGLPSPYDIINAISVCSLCLFAIVHYPVKHIREKNRLSGSWKVSWGIFFQEFFIIMEFYIILGFMGYQDWIKLGVPGRIILGLGALLVSLWYSLGMSLDKYEVM